MTMMQAVLAGGVILCAAGAWSALRAIAAGRPPATGLVAFVAGGAAVGFVHLNVQGGVDLPRILGAFGALGRQLVSLGP